MPDDLTPHYHRLTHSAALVGEFEGSPERQAELLAWVLEAVRAIAAARGIALEAGQPEPLPQHISRDLWPAQGQGDGDPAERLTQMVREFNAWVPGGGIRPALSESEDPDLGLIDAGMQWPRPTRTTIEAGAGFAPGELRRPDACDPAEDGAERVMQAAETWWGQQ